MHTTRLQLHGWPFIIQWQGVAEVDVEIVKSSGHDAFLGVNQVEAMAEFMHDRTQCCGEAAAVSVSKSYINS